MNNLQSLFHIFFLTVPYILSPALASTDVKPLTNDIETNEEDAKPAASERSLKLLGKRSSYHQPQQWFVQDNYYPSNSYPNTYYYNQRDPSYQPSTGNWYPSTPSTYYPNYPNYPNNQNYPNNRYPNNYYPNSYPSNNYPNRNNNYPNIFDPNYWLSKLPGFSTNPTYPPGGVGGNGGTNCIGVNCYQSGRYPNYSSGRYPSYSGGRYPTTSTYPSSSGYPSVYPNGYPTSSLPIGGYPSNSLPTGGYPSSTITPSGYPSSTITPNSYPSSTIRPGGYPLIGNTYPNRNQGNGGYGGYQGNGGLFSYSGYDGYYNSGNEPGNTGFGYQNTRLGGNSGSRFVPGIGDVSSRYPITTPTSVSRDA